MKWQMLSELSESKTVWESTDHLVGDFSDKDFPTTIDAREKTYSLYYRAAQ